MQNKYSCKTPIECKLYSVSFLYLFYGRELSWRTVQVQMREKKAQGGNSTGGEVWTFSSGCCPVWEAANVKRPDCEFPTEMGLVQRECEPISSLLSYLGTAAASICQLFMAATWGKRAPPLQFQEWGSFVKTERIFTFWWNQWESFPCLYTVYAGMFFSVEMHTDTGKRRKEKHSQHIFLYTSEIILIRVGHNWSKQSPHFSQFLPVNGACEHLCQVSSAFSNSLCWSTDAVKRVSCLRSTPNTNTTVHYRGEASGRRISHSIQ